MNKLQFLKNFNWSNLMEQLPTTQINLNKDNLIKP